MDGGVVSVQSNYAHWKYHPTDTSVDAAVLVGAPDEKEYDYTTLPVSMMVTDELIESEEIGPGDEVFLTGLFTSYTGTKRNLPIIRTGNIALMPEEKVFISKDLAK